MQKQLFYIIVILFAVSCTVIEKRYEKLPPGIYRATLNIDYKGPVLPSNEIASPKLDIVKPGVIPFLMEVTYDGDSMMLHFINGKQKIPADISFGRDKKTAKDTVYIDFPIYDTHIEGIYLENVIDGKWVVHSKDNYEIPFVAKFGEKDRFTDQRVKPDADITGQWKTTFSPDEDPNLAIGEFQQKDNYLTATFRTETGDYGFLEGTVQGDKVFLSNFDGSHAFLFEARIMSDTYLEGTFRSGKHYQTTWRAQKDNSFKLTHPDSMSVATEVEHPIKLELPDISGKMRSISDTEFEADVKILQIMGTWCPNCKDQAAFLQEFRKEHPGIDLKIIPIAFERYPELEKSQKQLNSFVKKYEIDYPVLFGGKADRNLVGEKLYFIDKLRSYPTMIFLDRDNKVRKVHTGFNGPATSEYENFKKDFLQTVKDISSQY